MLIAVVWDITLWTAINSVCTGSFQLFGYRERGGIKFGEILIHCFDIAVLTLMKKENVTI